MHYLKHLEQQIQPLLLLPLPQRELLSHLLTCEKYERRRECVTCESLKAALAASEEAEA